MKKLALFAEIDTLQSLTTPTVFEAGIWRYCLYADGEISLAFLNDTFNRTKVSYNNVIIDQQEYNKVLSLAELRAFIFFDKGAWYGDGGVIYIKFPFFNPPQLFYSQKYSMLTGYTDSSPMIIDGVIYKSGLLSVPMITKSVDAFTYDVMKFQESNVSIENSSGQFDEAGFFFGNEFNIKVAIVPERKDDSRRLVRQINESGSERVVAQGNTDEYVTLYQEEKKEEIKTKLLAQYYIENMLVTLEKADFKLSDKRERLSAKIPFDQYTVDKFPFIDDNLIGKDMQEVYGRCFQVPGVCIEGKRIYNDKNNISLGFLEKYCFRFSSKIARVDRIQVKMNNGELPDGSGGMYKVDGWTTVYRRETGEAPENWSGWKNHILPGDLSEIEKGIIYLSYAVAKHDGDREKRINDVRVDGVFIDFDVFPNSFDNYPDGSVKPTPRATPKDIIKHIMQNYSNIPYEKDYYDMVEFNDELEKLDPFEIGVVFDKSVSVYEAIEQLQGGSVLGFQFQLRENKFTARLDNPNRKYKNKDNPEEDKDTLLSISHTEILHLNEVGVDWNAELYGTYTDIEYARRYDEDGYSRWIDKNKRHEILSIHRMDKVWNVQTLLANEADAKLKSDVLLEDFKELKPIIRNIQLQGEKWFGLVEDFDELRIYDIIKIDFSIHGENIEKYPRHLIRLIDKVGMEKVVSPEPETDEFITIYNDEKKTDMKRDFMREISCQVISINPDTNTGTVTIDVRLAKYCKALGVR